MIPYSRQHLNESDIEAVVEVLRSEYLTQGPAVEHFENALIQYCRVSHAVAVSSATAALHAACTALGVGPGDQVWVAAVSFVASANCARYCGAEVSFVDIDIETGLLSSEVLGDRLKEAASKRSLPKVLVVVHLAGQSCDMVTISALCAEYGVGIVEDASHALGGRYKGEPVGGSRYSDCTVFSFHPVKPITAGEGGVVTTKDPELAQRIRRFISHGIERDPAKLQNPSPEPWSYEQQSLGYNYRLSDIHAALGASQMRRLDAKVSARARLAARYDQLLQDTAVAPLRRSPDVASAHHLYVIRCPSPDARNALYRRLREQGLGANVHYLPIESQPYYRERYPHARPSAAAISYGDTALSLPLYAEMDDAVVDAVVDICRSI